MTASGRLRYLPAGALVVLGGGLTMLIVTTTPWHPLSSPPGAAHADTDFTSGQIARAAAFYSVLRPLSYGSLAAGLLVLAVLGITPAGARIVQAVARPLGGRGVWRIVLGVIAVCAIHRAILVPFAVRAEILRRDYGLSTQPWGGWAADVAKSFGLQTGVAILGLLALSGLARALPRWWWAPAAVGGFVLVIVISFVYPVIVEPVFSSFRPMHHGQLRHELITLAHRDGVPVRSVLVADASRRTTAVNAYVSGFGGTRRIVVYDTLLESSSPAEVKLIVAHELGHAERHDVRSGTLIGALGVAAGSCLLSLLIRWRPLQRRAGISSAADPRAIPLILLIVGVLSTLAVPVQNLLSRQIEARADVHALNLTGEAGAYARMQHGLALRNLAPLRPGTVAYYVYATHPTAPQRIALAREWARIHGEPVPPPAVSDSRERHGSP